MAELAPAMTAEKGDACMLGTNLNQLDMSLVAMPTSREHVFKPILVHDRAPHQYSVVHSLGDYRVSKPTHTIHIVLMYLYRVIF